MKMYIEVESRAKALEQCYCTSRPALESVSSFVDQMCRNCAVPINNSVLIDFVDFSVDAQVALPA